jgi:hypothetical protein
MMHTDGRRTRSAEDLGDEFRTAGNILVPLRILSMSPVAEPIRPHRRMNNQVDEK